ncbi:MAG: aldose epimerase family protein [Candidatus Borkfalkiaceae bacterium]|nr:aldose epimerase family protein [Christensenellaceae bacterium]
MICKEFGNANGTPVQMYTLKNGKLEADILTYGGTIRAIRVPDKNGNVTDVVLGYDTIEEYMKNAGYLGAIIGRVGNRIENGSFVLNGKEYNIGKNCGKYTLHGGFHGFNEKVWKANPINDYTLEVSCFSPDGDEGFPANLNVAVVYTLTEKGLRLDYAAEADDDTVTNLTNHVYFNLSGEGNGTILNTVLTLDADEITPTDENLITHGEFMKIKNTPFDFNEPKEIARDIEADDKILKDCGGYDINYVLNGSGLRKFATAESPLTGIKLNAYTDRPGVQLYVGNFLDGTKGKKGHIYGKREGFCLETQNFPNAVNCKQYPSSVLKKGEIFKSTTVYEFEF